MHDTVSDIERTARQGVVDLGRDMLDSIIDGWPSRDDQLDQCDRGTKVVTYHGQLVPLNQ